MNIPKDTNIHKHYIKHPILKFVRDKANCRSGRLKQNINYNKVGNEDDFNFVSPPHCKRLRGDLLGGADGHETEFSHANADRVT
ncbi:hypothetical protein C4D60_Mb05t00420 [Musa balbisiana]|uniref:Uncharacterized protein n=1 Tax=Musa balbisiana TaxID=52838 RepID=A0A4S8JSN5_MUSBA|nr:hypothetical protein C4D60_Mb05t00420 [Musa balbisiana]